MPISWSAVGEFGLKVARVLRPSARDLMALGLVTTGLGILAGPFWQTLVSAVLESKFGIAVPQIPAATGWVCIALGIGVHFSRYLREPGEHSIDHRREQDEKTLTKLLSCIHVPTFEYFVECGHYHRMRMEILHFAETFHALANSEAGHLHNRGLRKKLARFDECWQEATSFGKWFTETPNANVYRFMAPHETNMPGMAQARDDFVRSIDRAQRALSVLLDRIRRRHPGIDLDETNKKAWEDFLAFESQ